MSFPSRTIGYGSGRGGEFLHNALMRWCGHALYDLRRNQYRDTGGSDKTVMVAGGPVNGLAWGSSLENNWYGDSTGMFASVDASHRFVISNNISDAQSEVFCIARIMLRPGLDAHMMSRGRDGSGNGWSMQGNTDAAGGVTHVVTTSGGDALRSASYSRVNEVNTWLTVHFAYKSGAYVRCGRNGLWLAETTFSATGLRSSSVGLGINKNNSFNATGNFFCRLWGMGTAVPPDLELLNLHEAILESERVYETPGGVLLSSVGVAGFASPPVFFH